MHVHPTRPAVHLAFAGGLALVAGLIAQTPAIVAWAGAVLVAVAVARSTAIASIARIRRAGFEMLWTSDFGDRKVKTVVRDSEFVLDAEVRNRDNRAARYVHLRPFASSNLVVTVEPRFGEVPANGRLRVTVHVRALRVGRHAIHGLSLEVQGLPGLFEAPLVFANPLGVEVLPKAFGPMLLSARGGRSRREADVGLSGPFSGDGTDLRELRDLHPGDPYKRIAWRASARRGKLVVRDFEHHERDVVWLIVDASVELWAGFAGRAPLDLVIDDVAAVARKHIARGDSVGLAIVGGRLLAVLEPDRGVRHARAIASALAVDTQAYDADRSELEERDVAIRVFEHLRPLDPLMGGLDKLDINRLAMRADSAMSRSLFAVGQPVASTQRERVLRHYLAAFGVESPPKSDPERHRTETAITAFLDGLAFRKPAASLVHVWSTSPTVVGRQLGQSLLRLRHNNVIIRWTAPRIELSLFEADGDVARAVRDAVFMRARLSRERGELALSKLGVRIQRLRAANLKSS